MPAIPISRSWKYAGFNGHPCVSIDPQWPGPHDQFQVFGYPREGGAEQLTPARLTYRGTHGTAPTAFLDLASDTIKPGMSGAAVLNLRTGGICGVVVASKHPARPDGAMVIPWPAVEAALGEVLAANRAYQLHDLQWATAAGRQDTQPPEPATSRPALGQSPGRPVRVFISYAHEDRIRRMTTGCGSCGCSCGNRGSTRAWTCRPPSSGRTGRNG